MEIIRHPGFLEIKLPDFFSLDPRTDNLSRVFTAVQPGTTSLLLDITEHRQKNIAPDATDILHGARMLRDALNAMTDNIETIALVVRPSHKDAVEAYRKRLEEYGFKVHLFTDRHRAASWLGGRWS
jgi:hypothetical protein